MRGFYKLNDSLRRLGLREVPKIPQKVVSRTTEDIVQMAFHAIDPDVFPPPSWLLDVKAIILHKGDHLRVRDRAPCLEMNQKSPEPLEHGFLVEVAQAIMLPHIGWATWSIILPTGYSVGW